MNQRGSMLKILVLLGGIVLISVGAGCALLYLVLPFTYRGPDLLVTNVTVASVAALTLGLGLVLSYHARRSLRGRPSQVFRPPSPWLVILIFVPCLILGQAVLSLVHSALFTSLAFPPFHIVAAVGPALAVLAFVGRRTRAGSWRTVSLELSHGALLAPMSAFAIELMALLLLVLLVSFIVALSPGGVERLMDLSLKLQNPAWLQDPANLVGIVLSPGVLTIIVVIFVFVAPLAEELFKGLGVLFLRHRLQGDGQALLWGVACGAGFAAAESLFNGSVALEAWWVVMVMRCGAALMHCVSTGLMGLGWYGAVVNKRLRRLLGTYVASAGLHALWNGAAIGIVVLSLLMFARPDDATTQGLAGLTVFGLLAFLFLLVALMALVLAYLTVRAGRGPVESTPLD
jgi:hypothetical protein